MLPTAALQKQVIVSVQLVLGNVSLTLWDVDKQGHQLAFASLMLNALNLNSTLSQQRIFVSVSVTKATTALIPAVAAISQRRHVYSLQQQQQQQQQLAISLDIEADGGSSSTDEVFAHVDSMFKTTSFASKCDVLLASSSYPLLQTAYLVLNASTGLILQISTPVAVTKIVHSAKPTGQATSKPSDNSHTLPPTPSPLVTYTSETASSNLTTVIAGVGASLFALVLIGIGYWRLGYGYGKDKTRRLGDGSGDSDEAALDLDDSLDAPFAGPTRHKDVSSTPNSPSSFRINVEEQVGDKFVPSLLPHTLVDAEAEAEEKVEQSRQNNSQPRLPMPQDPIPLYANAAQAAAARAIQTQAAAAAAKARARERTQAIAAAAAARAEAVRAEVAAAKARARERLREVAAPASPAGSASTAAATTDAAKGTTSAGAVAAAAAWRWRT